MDVSEANYHGEFSGGPGMVETTASPVIQSEAVVDKLQTLIPDIGVRGLVRGSGTWCGLIQRWGVIRSRMGRC